MDKVAPTITYAEATALAERLTHIDLKSDICATILLLIAAATYEPRLSEDTYYAARRVLMPEIEATNRACDEAQITVLRELRQAAGAQ
jgi:hypothetical protein